MVAIEWEHFDRLVCPIYLLDNYICIPVTSHVSCRVPEGLGEKVDEAAAESDATRSDVLRQALRQYIDEKRAIAEADNSPAEQSDGTRSGSSSSFLQTSPYDPTEDL
ncbi:CopG family ribbon-helix-helix protein [Haloarcula sediminis]|uniref:CopG family ribbon-helix-helix protein n=1 Tax=Haloarcula sediminis TaxID=3111777 RepID=UPI00387E8B36